MNWNAINALSTLGLFIIGVYALIYNSIDTRIIITMWLLILLFLALIVFHRLFRLIRKNKDGAVFLVRWGIKHWIENPVTLKKLGRTWDEVDSVSTFEFNLYPTGKSVNLSRKNK